MAVNANIRGLLYLRWLDLWVVILKPIKPASGSRPWRPRDFDNPIGVELLEVFDERRG